MYVRSAKTLILLTAALSMLVACVLPALPGTVGTSPTSNPNAIQTIVVATAGAAQTQTALVLPPPTITDTPTLVPTQTATETGTATPTVIFIIPTRTSTPTQTYTPAPTRAFETQSAGSGCELVAQSPGNDTVYGVRERFNVQWTVRNTGNETWFSNAVDFFYSSGRDMHNADIVDLPGNVRAGGEITLTVDMRTPGEAGTYTTNWTLGTRRNALCIVSVRVVAR